MSNRSAPLNSLQRFVLFSFKPMVLARPMFSASGSTPLWEHHGTVEQKCASHSFLCGTRQDTAASGGSHLLPFLLTEFNLTLTKCLTKFNDSKQILVWLCHQGQSKIHLFKTLDLKLFIIHASKTVGPGPPSSSVGRACNPCTEAAMLHAMYNLSRYPFLSAPKLSCQTKALKYPNNYKWTIDCGLSGSTG